MTRNIRDMELKDPGMCYFRYFTERLVRACAELPKLCEFFHIPFQSGDNDILREMKWVQHSSSTQPLIDH